VHRTQKQSPANFLLSFTRRVLTLASLVQAKDYDAQGEYVKLWLPELANVPTGFIFEPWKMPKETQEKAGVTIGKDYPAPIVAKKEFGPRGGKEGRGGGGKNRKDWNQKEKYKGGRYRIRGDDGS